MYFSLTFFRWKGENVSTAEVSLAISACPGVSDVTVYGVAIPHCDGRAGNNILLVLSYQHSPI